MLTYFHLYCLLSSLLYSFYWFCQIFEGLFLCLVYLLFL